MKHRISILLCAVLALLCLASASADSPYYITVDLANQIVTVYKNGSDQEHIVRQMICSAGSKETPTMLGTYTMVEKQDSNERKEWYRIGSGYVKWATRIKWGTMFHSIPYNSKRSSYNSQMAAKMGEPYSNGCIRLWTEDAWWIATHVPPGTKVRIYDDADRDEALRDLLLHVTFSIDDGSYEQFLRGMYTLRLWSWGDRVKSLQGRLNMLGYACGEPDGEFGRDTEDAVKAFQAQNGLEQDGTVPEAVWNALFNVNAVPAPVTDGTYGLHVYALQQDLQALGSYSGPLNATYDAGTAAALRDYVSRYMPGTESLPSPRLLNEIHVRAALADADAKAPAAEAPTMAVTALATELLEQPDAMSVMLSSLSRGTAVQVLEDLGQYLRVRAGGRMGYLDAGAVELQATAPTQVAVSQETAQLYHIEGGSVTAAGEAHMGDTFRLIDTGEQFYIIDADGQSLWISKGDAEPVIEEEA